MKNIEDQYRSIKNDYGEKISTSMKNRLQKYMNVVRQMVKLQLIKGLQQKQDDKISASVKNQLLKFRRCIENEYKINFTDFQAYLWKMDKILRIQKPALFQKIKLQSQGSIQISVQAIKKNINFPILNCKVKQLLKVGTELLMQNKFCAQNFSQAVIVKLIALITMNYNILPYHSFTHAFSVFVMLIQCRHLCQNLSKVFSQFDLFIASIAALAHDLNHKGTNTAFQIKRQSDLALMYNNQSVLENMHISQFYRICKENPDIDIISQMKSPVQRESAKRLFSRLILATDVEGHNKNLKKLQVLASQKKQYSDLKTNEKQLILENLFHACDIGNPCLDYENYNNWSLLIAHQFNNQALMQKSEGVQISSHMQFVDIQTHYRRQIGFIDFLVFPIWKQITNIFPNFSPLKKKIQQNKLKLTSLIDN